MKEKILQKSGEFFLKFGFKSVTMDDIANELGISKKTIYKYFGNKEELVDESISHLHGVILKSVSCICDKGYNAIEENFEIKNTFKDLFKNTDDSPMYQLQKYYPKTYNKLMTDEFHMFKNCILKNIEKGINEGLYRDNINIELITKFYFSLVMSVHDTNLHKYNKNTINTLELKALEYHTRAIATEKGIKILEKQLEQNAN
ncbi:TetR/AcrR family transcriptional regulator [Lutibacter maritimus]|uniref:Transcriptional regulator, TetR family n=1 Tax=Lutibacter maritimus TaxID=593133 RepID=A0A1I6Q3H1_9FLAO|nr:TetR/AcrR family transcriptional regulator [Lutibacter maritimus]SFS47016.1 transcriptional regulator, TetR family [Lutibacter maritimus]